VCVGYWENSADWLSWPRESMICLRSSISVKSRLAITAPSPERMGSPSKILLGATIAVKQPLEIGPMSVLLYQMGLAARVLPAVPLVRADQSSSRGLPGQLNRCRQCRPLVPAARSALEDRFPQGRTWQSDS
jgi:hypothetical protein